MLSRLAPLVLVMVAACSRSPEKTTTVAEWEREHSSTAGASIENEPSVATKRPFPCCNPEEPVGFFPDYSLRIEVSEK